MVGIRFTAAVAAEDSRRRREGDGFRAGGVSVIGD